MKTRKVGAIIAVVCLMGIGVLWLNNRSNSSINILSYDDQAGEENETVVIDKQELNQEKTEVGEKQ